MFVCIPGHRITRQGDRGSGGGGNDFAGRGGASLSRENGGAPPSLRRDVDGHHARQSVSRPKPFRLVAALAWGAFSVFLHLWTHARRLHEGTNSRGRKGKPNAPQERSDRGSEKAQGTTSRARPEGDKAARRSSDRAGPYPARMRRRDHRPWSLEALASGRERTWHESGARTSPRPSLAGGKGFDAPRRRFSAQTHEEAPMARATGALRCRTGQSSSMSGAPSLPPALPFERKSTLSAMISQP